MAKSIFAISGSLRAGSSNHNILKFVGMLMPTDVNYFVYDSLARIPPFDPGNDHEHVDNYVSELRGFIKNADAVIICTPEYSYGVPGQLKNVIDWMVSSASFSGKPTALITASTGGETAHSALLKILGAVDADVDTNATLLTSFIRSKMNGVGDVTDADTQIAITKVVTSLLSKANV